MWLQRNQNKARGYLFNFKIIASRMKTGTFGVWRTRLKAYRPHAWLHPTEKKELESRGKDMGCWVGSWGVSKKAQSKLRHKDGATIQITPSGLLWCHIGREFEFGIRVSVLVFVFVLLSTPWKHQQGQRHHHNPVLIWVLQAPDKV